MCLKKDNRFAMNNNVRLLIAKCNPRKINFLGIVSHYESYQLSMGQKPAYRTRTQIIETTVVILKSIQHVALQQTGKPYLVSAPLLNV